MIVVTGANGQLGRLVIQGLLQKLPAASIVAAVRSPDKAQDLAALGVQLRQADYTRPATLDAAFQGASKLLLISSSEVGQRVPQHRAVIDAAVRAKVGLLAYTSVLHANSSPLGLAAEHLETEAMLQASGLPYVLLRNGWYTENYLAGLAPAIEHGALIGSAGGGRISSAARADYAAAAVAVLTSTQNLAGRIYELAGDSAYSLSDLAAEIARQSGKAVAYRNLSEADYKAALIGVGLPEPVAGLISDSDVGASKGGLYDDRHLLSELIGRPTTPMAVQLAAALKAGA
ncbi:SDR family oxidoreductase [Hydrocarboniphaga sp.]|uniref:SDR family oxidoreductase n=1 Tax=Hydrocarboniphaga sp. TaxID=2033016 RepID=UPI003D0F2B26